MTYKKKLIEVAIPLEAINAASAREKSIRHGHPSTLHLWWARRPLAACRAVLFAQLVDDPSSLPEQFPTSETQDAERKRLFAIIEDLVKWENSTNEEVLERARAEIRRSCGGVLPPVYDPFSGGGSIPLEAQRLGLRAYGSDLNPVAVMIGKAMIEIPPKFKDMPPIHPGIKERQFYRNAEGLAEDVKYYGEWMREKAWERVGHLYPQVDLPKDYGENKATVMAWIWARTVPSPDPAFMHAQVPLVSSYVLSTKTGREAWLTPVVDKITNTYRFEINTGKNPAALKEASTGTKAGRATFRCIFSDTPMSGAYIDKCAQAGQMSAVPIAAIAKTKNGTIFLGSSALDGKSIDEAAQKYLEDSKFELGPLDLSCRGTFASNAQGRQYGFRKFSDYFTDRQKCALLTLSELVEEAAEKIVQDAESENRNAEYSLAIATYLTFIVSQLTNHNSSMCGWNSANVQMRSVFARQGIAMTWDFAECNPFGGYSGSYQNIHERMVKAFETIGGGVELSQITAQDAKVSDAPLGSVICTDPPYYDNITYSDLSDFFYVWIKRCIGKRYGSVFSAMLTPKQDELVAESHRHGNSEVAEEFFSKGIRQAIQNLARFTHQDFPTCIFYAFKQSEIEQEGISSSGWATFIDGVISSGFEVKGTWPVRTEKPGRVVSVGTNALANSVVLVCRKKAAAAETVTRAEFIRALKRELPPAIAELQAANIAPADMPQSAIGPGMGVFSRYKAVLESDDSPMSVKAALQLINKELDEFMNDVQGEFDADTRFAITWYEQNGMKPGEYGVADNLARARGIAVESVKHAGIIESQAGKVRILKRDEMQIDWAPETDKHATIWEMLQYLVRLHEHSGLSNDAAALLKRYGVQGDAVKDLAYCLYDIAANKRKEASEATAYNALIADWTELSRMAASVSLEDANRQLRFEV